MYYQINEMQLFNDLDRHDIYCRKVAEKCNYPA